MDRTDPHPREPPIKYARWSPRVASAIPLRAAGRTPTTSFLDVLERRRSNRQINPTTIDRIGTWLWYAARTRQTGVGRANVPWEHRAAASAGGLHPVLLLMMLPDLADTVCLYEPIRHQLLQLDLADRDQLRVFGRRVSEISVESHGAIGVMAIDSGVTDAVYENSASLAWRDCGYLMAVLHLCAESVDMAVCPLGLLGDELLRAVGAPGPVWPGGAFVIGELTDATEELSDYRHVRDSPA